MSQRSNTRILNCPTEAALAIIGGKWKGIILCHIRNDTRRFNELRRLIPQVSQRMLTKQLRELETHQIIHRKIYRQIPPKVEYSLTEFGLTLDPILRALEDWGTEYIDKITELPDYP
ncbi:MAG: helix-turn-helix transcriptional regulator [Robiginitomaculum sp.]|nr:helix-turn-helix transcriptional regulator [Robiginitomaculum sp.]